MYFPDVLYLFSKSKAIKRSVVNDKALVHLIPANSK